MAGFERAAEDVEGWGFVVFEIKSGFGEGWKKRLTGWWKLRERLPYLLLEGFRVWEW
jgi:hypothetical protein